MLKTFPDIGKHFLEMIESHIIKNAKLNNIQTCSRIILKVSQNLFYKYLSTSVFRKPENARTYGRQRYAFKSPKG